MICTEKAQACKQAAWQAIDDQAAKLTAFAQDIAQNPELGYKEQRTSQKVLQVFQQLGLQNLSFPALTGVKGWMEFAPGNTSIAIIGEMDAVISPGHPMAAPGTSAAHACGHHAQLAAMLGTAIGLQAVKSQLRGKACFIAAPAEEYIEIEYRSELKKKNRLMFLGGKQQLIAEGAFDDVDMAMMVHAETDAPGIHVVVNGPAGGFIGKTVRFAGKEAHAGGAPWQGVNALNAAALAIQAIHAQRETFRDTDKVRVHPIITKGGDSVNTVPGDVRMESYVRAGTVQAMKEANAKVNRALRGAAYAIGAEVDICDMPGYLPLTQNAALSRIFAENARQAEPQAVVEDGIEFCGSTDMGDLSYILPVIQPTVNGFSGTLHSKDFAVRDEYAAYILPAKIMAATVIDVLLHDEIAGTICNTALRHSAEEYKMLWQAIIQQKNEADPGR